MNRSALFILGILVLLTGCKSAATDVPEFELRDFKVDTELGTYGTTYKFRGTLLGTTESARKNTYWVVLNHSSEGKDGITAVLVRDGTGIVEVTEVYSLKEQNSPPKYTWTIIGALPVSNAKLTVKQN